MEFVEEFSDDEKLKVKNEFSKRNGQREVEVVYFDCAGSMLYGENQVRQVGEMLASNLFCNPHTSKATDNVIDAVRFR
jgi:molybdenum cofactor sulfurtransferase